MDARPDRDQTIEDFLAERATAAHVFLRRRMACVGCAMARFDTLGDAARIYGIPEIEFLDDLAAAEG